MKGSGLFKYANRTFHLTSRLRRIRDRRRLSRVELRGHVLLTGLLMHVLAKSSSIRAAADKRGGILSEEPVLRFLLGRRWKERQAVAHADTLYEYLRHVYVGHLQRLDVQLCKRLKRMRALYWQGLVLACLDATWLSLPGDVYADQGALAKTRKRKKKGPDGKEQEVEHTVYNYCLANLYTVGGPVRAYLGFQNAEVGEIEAARKILKWALETYGPGFIDVLMADRLYCSCPELQLLDRVAARGWIVRAHVGRYAVKRAKQDLDKAAWEVFRIKGERTRVRAVDMRWLDLGISNLKLFEVRRDGARPLLFVTNLPWSLERLARAARERWGIENQLHKEIKHEWPFRHLPSRLLRGMMAWWWIVAIAFNIFHAYFGREVEPRLKGRGGYSSLRVALEHLRRHLADDELVSLHEQFEYG